MPNIAAAVLHLPRNHPLYDAYEDLTALIQIEEILERINQILPKLKKLNPAPNTFYIICMREYGVLEQENEDNAFTYRSVNVKTARILRDAVENLAKDDPYLLIITPPMQIQDLILDASELQNIYSSYKEHADIKLEEFRIGCPRKKEEELSLKDCIDLKLQMILHERSAFLAMEKLTFDPYLSMYKVTNTTYVATYLDYYKIDKRAPYYEVPQIIDSFNDNDDKKEESKTEALSPTDSVVIWKPPQADTTSTKVKYTNPYTDESIEFDVMICRAFLFQKKLECPAPIQFVLSDSITLRPEDIRSDFVIQADSRQSPVFFTRLSKESLASHPYQISVYENNLLETSTELTFVPVTTSLSEAKEQAEEKKPIDSVPTKKSSSQNSFFKAPPSTNNLNASLPLSTPQSKAA